MTPNRRLDQLEPLMADSLQKIDRLIEGQGQLVELATRTEESSNTTAKEVASLTVKVDQITDDQTSLTTKVDRIADDQASLTTKVDRIADDQTSLTMKVDRIADDQTSLTMKVDQITDDQASLRQEVRQGFDEVNQRFDQLITLIQERLS